MAQFWVVDLLSYKLLIFRLIIYDNLWNTHYAPDRAPFLYI